MIAKSSAGMTSDFCEIKDWKRISFITMKDILDLMGLARNSRFLFPLPGREYAGSSLQCSNLFQGSLSQRSITLHESESQRALVGILHVGLLLSGSYMHIINREK